ncbi:hypothetical protein [Nocardia sp. NRRL S-836]|uniref:hypothetical protein n=1 Tax=Nocardia sp. NRRL S-836 TaxID=1519492 RepID=UPI0012F8EC6E|nr:hypothetical protein [Nocardia sp. NRRL S-836]
MRIGLGALTGLSLLCGVLALLRFLSAAHGKPEAVSAHSVIDEGGVNVRDVRLATEALKDLAVDRALALISAALLAPDCQDVAIAVDELAIGGHDDPIGRLVGLFPPDRYDERVILADFRFAWIHGRRDRR